MPLVLTDSLGLFNHAVKHEASLGQGRKLVPRAYLEGISEFQLPVKIMSSKHANAAVICPVLEPCLPQLSWELGVYAQFGVTGIYDILSIEN